MAKSNNIDSNLSLVELVQQKEKEWREAQDLRVKSLEISLKEQEKLLNNERLRFKKLKEDFQYNLQLLSERDQELERYDQIFAKYKNIESERDGEISELKIRMDHLKSKLLQEVNEREGLQKHYQKVSEFTHHQHHDNFSSSFHQYPSTSLPPSSSLISQI